MNRRSKHIDVRYKFICEKVNEGTINITYCPTEIQIADIFTQPLKFVKFEKFKNALCSQLKVRYKNTIPVERIDKC